jgi:hypothetical protein
MGKDNESVKHLNHLLEFRVQEMRGLAKRGEELLRIDCEKVRAIPQDSVQQFNEATR